MNAYNLTDAYFVSRLGTAPLAAMSFTFPVVMFLSFVAGGIGTGVTALVSHAIGRRDHADAARLVTHGMALAVATAVVLSIAGYLCIDWLFRRLGADETTLPLVGAFMRTWYLGALTMALPMMGNGILISVGDSAGASRFMIFGTVLNAALNPVMIFGLLGFPAMGIRGSALATVVSQAFSTAWLLYLLRGRHRLLAFRRWTIGEYLSSFRRILAFAVPSILSLTLMPISSGVITRILSGFGHEAVAAVGVAVRIEFFAFVIPMALGMSMTPFASQNFGAGRLDRVREGRSLATRFALLYGAAVAVVFFACAPLLATLFTDDPKVSPILVSYIRIVSFGYGMMETHRYSGFILTGLQRPVSTTLLNALRVVAVLIPLSWLGARWFGVEGVFFGRLATDFIVGGVGIFWVSRAFDRISAAGTAGKRGGGNG
jgi:putative MATE family efflux protein